MDLYQGAQIVAPHFCAGLTFDEDNKVVSPAPILNYMRGWHRDKVEAYCANKGWSLNDSSSN